MRKRDTIPCLSTEIVVNTQVALSHGRQHFRDGTRAANTIKTITSGLVFGASLILVACGGGSGGGSASTNTNVSGVAATGAPIVGGAVTLTCLNSFTTTAITSTNGQWSATVPNANLPCAAKVENGTVNGSANTAVFYSTTTTGTGSQTVNITPLTSLTLAQAVGATTTLDVWFANLDDAGRQSLAASIATAITALNTALASYALPAGFNPLTSPLAAATTGQAGNDYDRLLDQLQAALGSTSFDTLLTTFAAGDGLPTPSYTEGASDLANFFADFAGDYTLKVTGAGAEGANNATVTGLFPLNSARVVHIKASGDVSIDAVGRVITFKAADYNTTFMGSASSENQLHYRTKDSNAWLDLYITYSPSTGALRVSPQGFVKTEGYANLNGKAFVPPKPPVDPGTPTGDSATATGNISSTSIESPGFTPDSDGFSVAVDYKSITYTFLATDIVNSNHDISIETDLNGHINALSYRDGSRLGTTKSLVCGSNYSTPCSGVSITPVPASKSVSIGFANASMTLRDFTTMTTETASFNGSLTGTLPGTHAFTASDLPRSTDGILAINGSSEAILSTSVGISSTTIPAGLYTVSTIEMRSQSGKLTLTRTITPTAGAPTTVDDLVYLKSGEAGIYTCSNCATALAVTESGGFMSIKLQNVVMTSAGVADLALNNTISIGSTSGSLSSTAGDITVTDSSVYSKEDSLIYRFTAAASTITIELKQGTSTAAMISVQHGGKLYTCFEQAQAILGTPACGGSIAISTNRRTLTLSNISLNSGKFAGNSALTIGSGTLTNQGL